MIQLKLENSVSLTTAEFSRQQKFHRKLLYIYHIILLIILSLYKKDKFLITFKLHISRLYPLLLGLLVTCAYAFWHLNNPDSLSFDSIRYYQSIIQMRSSLTQENPSFLSIHNFNKEPLWILILSLCSLGANKISLSILLFINNLVSYTALFFSFTSILNYFNFTKIKKITAFILLLSSFPLIDMGKVLMPELLSLGFLMSYILCLLHYQNTKHYSYLFFSLLFALFTGLSNFSNIYYLTAFYFLFLILFTKQMLKTLPFYLLLGSLFLFGIAPLKSIVWTSLTRPDISGSWNTATTFFSALFWQIFGLVNTTCGLIWFFLIFIGLSNFLKKESLKHILIWGIFILFILSGLAWIKPLTGHDFISTGYRYQLPLLVFLSIFSSKGFASPFSLIKKIFLILLLSLLFIEGFLRNAPLLKEYTFKIQFSIPPTLKNQLQWDGSLILFNGANNIISGGTLSRIPAKKSLQAHLADKIYKKLSTLSKKERWIQFIVPDPALYFAFVKKCLEYPGCWNIMGDYKNPVFPESLKEKLFLFKNSLPSYHPLKPDFIFLSETDYLLIDRSSKHTEPELQSIHEQYLAEFQRIQNQFILLERLSPSLELYKNIHSYGRNLPSPSSQSNNSLLWALYYSDSIKEPSFIEQFTFFKTLLKKEKIPFVVCNENEMKSLISSQKISSILLPYGPSFPKSCISSMIYFIEKGGNVWFTGGLPFSKLIPEPDPLLSRYLYQKIGLHLISPAPLKGLPDEGSFSDPLFPGSSSISFLFHGSKTIFYKPSQGNIFPYRWPCAHWETLKSSADSNLGFFYQFYKNPYEETRLPKILLWNKTDWSKGFKNEKEKNLFSLKILKSFTNPLHFISLKPESLIVSSNREPQLQLTLENSGIETISTFIHFKKTDSLHPDFQWSIPITLKRLTEETFHIPIPTPLTQAPLIHFKAWTDTSLINLKTSILTSPSLHKTSSSHFLDCLSNPKKSFIKGVNYYPSNNYDRFWLSLNLSDIDQDFTEMAKQNLNLVRIHYIHPEWYKNIDEKVFNNRLKIKEDYPPWESLHAILRLAELHNLTICFDLFSLVGSKMGNSEGWTRDPSRFSDQEKIIQQNIFLIQFLKETADYNNLHIDLINEPEISESDKEIFIRWVKEKTGMIKSVRRDIPVTVGFRHPGLAIKELDYYSLHDYKILPLPYHDKPVILQEYWLSKPLSFPSSKTLPSYSGLCEKAKQMGYKGFMPWIFRSPEILTPLGSPEEAWEASLGFFKNPDGSERIKD